MTFSWMFPTHIPFTVRFLNLYLRNHIDLASTVGRLDCSSIPPLGLPNQTRTIKLILAVQLVCCAYFHSQTVYIGPYIIGLTGGLPSVSRAKFTLAPISNAVPFACERIRKSDRFFLCQSHGKKFSPHPVTWLAISLAFSPRIIHLSTNGLAGQSCVPDMIRSRRHVIHRIETRRRCAFVTSSQPHLTIRLPFFTNSIFAVKTRPTKHQLPMCIGVRRLNRSLRTKSGPSNSRLSNLPHKCWCALSASLK